MDNFRRTPNGRNNGQDQKEITGSGIGESEQRSELEQQSPLEQQSESEQLSKLISLIGRGNEAALGRLYDLTSPRIYGLALCVVHDRALAATVAQDVYTQVWSSAPRFDPADHTPWAWLLMQTHRSAVAAARRIQDSGTGVFHDSFDRGIDDIVTGPDPVFRTATPRAANRLESLFPDERETLCLAYYEGLTYGEIADRLHVDAATITTRIDTGLIQLKACAEEG